MTDTTKQMKATGRLEVGLFGREHSENDPLYFAIIGPVGAGRTGNICDTLNSDFLLTNDERHAWLQKLVDRHDAHDDMKAALEAAEHAMAWAHPHLEADPITEERGINDAHASALAMVRATLSQQSGEGKHTDPETDARDASDLGDHAAAREIRSRGVKS